MSLSECKKNMEQLHAHDRYLNVTEHKISESIDVLCMTQKVGQAS